MTRLNPYINFTGNAREAMEFYKTVFGGKLDMSTYKDGGMPHDAGEDTKIMHAMLVAENGITLMAADTPNSMPQLQGGNISISLSGENEAELKGYWEKLSAGATITMPLEKAPWGDTFGMLTDTFGIGWMVNIAGAKA